MSPVREHQLPVEVDHHQRVQPFAPSHRLRGVMVHATYEEGTDRTGLNPTASTATRARRRGSSSRIRCTTSCRARAMAASSMRRTKSYRAV